MRILLIKPPYNRLKQTNVGATFPLGLGYIAGVLIHNGFDDVSIYNADNSPRDRFIRVQDDSFDELVDGQLRYRQALRDDDHIVWHEIRETLITYRPEILGVSVHSVDVAAARRISSICKEVLPLCRVVWGGAHATLCSESVLTIPEVDFVVRGEGEYTCLELVQCLDEGRDVSEVTGISYRHWDTFIHTPDRGLIDCLDDLPFPARSNVLYPERYDKGSWGDLIASRGCPWDCSFCSAKALWGKPRFRSTGNVISEINSITESFGTWEYFFHDDTFASSKQWTEEFCERLISEKTPVIWVATTRVDRLDQEIISLMKRAGCWKLFLGIESGSDQMLRSINKGITVQKIREAAHLMDREHLLYNVFFMAGFPDEREEDLKQTLHLMQSLNSSAIIFSIFQPLPGSRLYKELEPNITIDNAGNDDISYYTPDNYHIKAMSHETFGRLLREIILFRDRHNSSWTTVLTRKVRFAQAMLTHCPRQLLGRIVSNLLHRGK
jgi:anaerobic magnesium-protoporphyrin IX monomethyl ester cyclase